MVVGHPAIRKSPDVRVEAQTHKHKYINGIDSKNVSRINTFFLNGVKLTGVKLSGMLLDF